MKRMKRRVTFAGMVLVLAAMALSPASRMLRAEDSDPSGLAGLGGVDTNTDAAMENLEEFFPEDAEKPAPKAEAPTEEIPEITAEPATEGEVDDLSRSLTSETKQENAPAELPEDPSLPNQITNLEFKHDEKGSKVVVSSLRKIRYTENKGAGTRQYVYLMENTQTPEKFQRAYDTTEFTSPVALFTLFQLPGGAMSTSKLIIQLREDQVPTVIDSDRGLVIEFGPAKAADPQIVDPGKKDIFASGDNIYARSGNYTGEVIQRLEIKNSDVQDVLRLIARTSGYNIVIGDDVQGKIGTLSLTNIPWDQAFTLVLQSKRLGFIREGNVLRIGTSASLRSEREEAAAVEKAQEKVEPLKTVLLPVSYAKAAELAPRAKPFLTERGAVEVDVRTNTIIIKDTEKVVARLQRLLQSLDTQPPRVSISARIVEMRSKLTSNIGMQLLSGRGTWAGVSGTNSVEAVNTLSGGGSFTTTIRAPDFANLNATFALGELDNKLKLLANPTIAVVANQTGTVSQSLSFFVPQNTFVNGVLTPGFTQVNTALNLSVTPIVSGDGSIFMNVSITNDIPNPDQGNTQIASRSVSTQVLVENGDTAVIGGVFQNSVSTDKSGFPLLMRIPLLGYLFSTTTEVDNRTEIFIFLTAKIMNAEQSFKRTL